MTIRKKSLTGSLGPQAEGKSETARPTPDAVRPADAKPAHAMSAEDLTLAKRTVSRILLAKSLFGR